MPAASKREWLSRCMGMACAGWGWSAEEFWRATPLDLMLIVQGTNAARRGGFDTEDVKELRALLNREEAVAEHGVR